MQFSAYNSSIRNAVVISACVSATDLCFAHRSSKSCTFSACVRARILVCMYHSLLTLLLDCVFAAVLVGTRGHALLKL
jgi:hypothetical protein